ncbi:MAG: UDP-N-acetylmuramoyl-L-alanine--D-glutamate ligase [Pseudoxanthomonas suwonensis]|nr:UDP-N-acetylmuramoyl-L-alanine--D-glutamate ligase [Pseudoxanthomonas suwonensis]
MTSTASPRRCGNRCVNALLPDGGRIALWGWGREGKAAYACLRSGRPPFAAFLDAPLTLFCRPDEVADAAAMGDARLAIRSDAGGEQLAEFDAVIKSPGISPHGEAAAFGRARGTRFIGGTAMWFAARPDARTLCVTGTKGKSTTSALLAHLLRAAGRRTALAGNIGLPLLELLEADAEDWVIELSSYQTGDVADSGVRPLLALVTNIFPEHLDWHGSHQQYVDDKLALLRRARPRIAVLNAADNTLATVGRGLADARDREDTRVIWFNTDDGWHQRDGVIHRGDEAVLDTAALPLPGRHNRGNLCGVLAALEALGMDARGVAGHARSFVPLPNRLQRLGVRDGIEVVNDSISTTPHASLAALEVFSGKRIALLVGGHDRGLDWQPFVDAMHQQAPHCIVTMGANGPRIHAMLSPLAATDRFRLHAADDLADAVVLGRAALGREGVLLLSPGAPSFGAYRDYVARGRHFAELTGFDPDLISAIPGLGIA